MVVLWVSATRFVKISSQNTYKFYSSATQFLTEMQKNKRKQQKEFHSEHNLSTMHLSMRCITIQTLVYLKQDFNTTRRKIKWIQLKFQNVVSILYLLKGLYSVIEFEQGHYNKTENLFEVTFIYLIILNILNKNLIICFIGCLFSMFPFLSRGFW